MKALRVPLLLFALPATLLACLPFLAPPLVLHRDALVTGELWRMWTGHWVHFSSSHLAWNLLVALASGTWLEHVRPGMLLRHTLLAAPAISLALSFGEPAMRTYGGLSALATGLVTLLALVQLARHAGDRALWLAVLAITVAKSAYDFNAAHAVFTEFGATEVRPSALAHAAGAGEAFMFYLFTRTPRLRRPAATSSVTPTTS